MVEMPTESEPVKVVEGDCLELLKALPDGCVQTCVTSPPYWGGLRDYGHAKQVGMERLPTDYTARLVEVFRAVRRVLRDDGTAWLNVGDVYAASGKGGGGSAGSRASWESVRERKGFRMPPAGYKMKDLTLTPFVLADALRRDGWYLRQTVVWEKPAATEPARLDRPSLSHEYLFLLAKSEQYATRNPGEAWWHHTVWKIQPKQVPGHPAAMPEELARRCIVSSSKPGELVIDPFGGSGTTGLVAAKSGRRAILCELNPAYAAICRQRVAKGMDAGLFNDLEGVA